MTTDVTLPTASFRGLQFRLISICAGGLGVDACSAKPERYAQDKEPIFSCSGDFLNVIWIFSP